MNATRDVITDLLPLYFSGEASADTRALVEEYFATNPEFERMARRMATSLTVLKATTLNDEDALEERTLVRTRAALRARNMSLGVVITGIVLIVILTVAERIGASVHSPSYPLLVLGCVAILAILAKRTQRTGL